MKHAIRSAMSRFARAFALILSVLSLAASSGAAHAGRQHLVFVGSEGRSGWTQVKVVTDANGALVGLDVGGDEYSAEQIRTGAWIKVDGVDHPRVLQIKASPSTSVASGGMVTFKYLYDGRGDGTYRKVEFELKPVNGRWKLLTPGNDTPVSSLYMRKHRATIFNVVVGISRISVTRERGASGSASGAGEAATASSLTAVTGRVDRGASSDSGASPASVGASAGPSSVPGRN